jgi:hypothetical protein
MLASSAVQRVERWRKAFVFRYVFFNVPAGIRRARLSHMGQLH